VRRRELRGVTAKVVFVYSIFVALLHIYLVYVGGYEIHIVRSLHLGTILSLAFIFFPAFKTSPKDRPSIFDVIFAILSFVSFFYITINWESLAMHWTLTRPLTTLEIIMGTICILSILEVARRVVGISFSIIAALFISYLYLGPYLPGLISHRGYSWSQIVDLLYLGIEGLFGIPVHVSFTYIFPLVIFSSFLSSAGAAKFVSDLAKSMTRRTKGGPAKATILANYFLGMITGNAAANVYLTADLAKEDMIKSGYKNKEVAGVVAAAATGAQISPPVMGAVAFIMAEFLGVPYLRVAAAAVIPAFLLYLAMFLTVDLRARSLRMQVRREEREIPLTQVLKDGVHLFTPLILFVILLIQGFSIPRIALYSAFATILVSFVRKHTRLGPRKILEALANSTRNIIIVAVAMGIAGIIAGSTTVSGLGFKFTRIALTLSGGNHLILLILVMIATIILGMGMPPTGAYVTAVALLIPALYEIGFSALPSHMFIFYFACFAVITPPVAAVAYIAAQISGCGIWEAGYEAVKYSIVAFIVPFAFVFNQTVLGIGSVTNVAFAIFISILSIFAISISVAGYFLTYLNILERAAFLGAGLVLLTFNEIAILISVVVLMAALLETLRRSRRARKTGSSVLNNP
jgi:TRAP transporter 4TM/12TM fusion protein